MAAACEQQAQQLQRKCLPPAVAAPAVSLMHKGGAAGLSVRAVALPSKHV